MNNVPENEMFLVLPIDNYGLVAKDLYEKCRHFGWVLSYGFYS